MKNLLFLLFLVSALNLQSQVAVNTDGTAPDNSAMLDVKSTTMGMLFPRMTQSQRNAIASPANGLAIYQTDNTPGIYVNTGSAASPVWIITGSGSSWSITGNSGTSAGTNFIGTADAQALMFKVNNQKAGYIDNTFPFNTGFGYQSINSTIGLFNSAFGFQALFSNTLGSGNTASGYQALYFNTDGYHNTAHGSGALYANYNAYDNTAAGFNALAYNTRGNRNTAIGSLALSTQSFDPGFNWESANVAVGFNALLKNQPTTLLNGVRNTAIGTYSLETNTTGYQNTGSGEAALYSNTNGYNNCAVGYVSSYFNTAGIDNTATGVAALYNNSVGNYNTATGREALVFNTTDFNTAVGYHASHTTSTGFQNTSAGANSLVNNTSGSYNTAVGWNTGPNAANLSNTTCIGTDATATATDMVRIGNVFVNSIGGYANWTNISDSRFKENVKEDVPGIAFIKQLRPVSYQLNREKINEYTGVTARQDELRKQDASVKCPTGEKYSQVTTGFIAQEVEAAARSVGFNFSGVDAPKNEKDFYGLRYAEFVVPLVKAVQELNAANEAQKAINDDLKAQNEKLLQRIEKLENK